ncbi:MAG: uracil phosphoribosyltransferase [Candidatus Hydrogenedentota bacterium]
MLKILDHPVLKAKLSEIRNKNTPFYTVRRLLKEITAMSVFAILEDVEVIKINVKTPLEKTTGVKVKKDIVLVPILRAGLGMVDGFLNVIGDAKIGFMGLYRNEETLEPVDYYRNLPLFIAKKTVILLDPMLATGGSAKSSCDYLKSQGVKDLRYFCLVAAPEGIKLMEKHHPDVKIFAVALDRKLNDKGYILPGLGDAGDRLYGTYE